MYICFHIHIYILHVYKYVRIHTYVQAPSDPAHTSPAGLSTPGSDSNINMNSNTTSSTNANLGSLGENNEPASDSEQVCYVAHDTYAMYM